MDDLADPFRQLRPGQAVPEFAPGTKRLNATTFRPGIYQMHGPSEEEMAMQAREAAARAQRQSVRHY